VPCRPGKWIPAYAGMTVGVGDVRPTLHLSTEPAPTRAEPTATTLAGPSAHG
jgi:hypothetical protein